VGLIYGILGETAFKLPKKEDSQEYKAPTKTIYDSIMQAFAKNIEHKDTLFEKKDKILDKLYQDSDSLNRADKEKNPYLFDGRYNNRKDVTTRIEYYNNFLQQFIH